jgi:hypothetical protein
MVYEDREYGTLPVTAEEWRPYLAEYGEWYLSNPVNRERVWGRLSEEQRQAEWMGREPATEKQIAAAEHRLGIALPPSLRGFLLAANGWGPVSQWTDGLCCTEQVEWFRDANEAFIDGYLSGAEDFGEEIDEEADIFLNALSVAYGEDTILLDTVHKSPDGEYAAYLLAVKYGELHETCASFSAAIAKGRAEIEGVTRK